MLKNMLNTLNINVEPFVTHYRNSIFVTTSHNENFHYNRNFIVIVVVSFETRDVVEG